MTEIRAALAKALVRTCAGDDFCTAMDEELAGFPELAPLVRGVVAGLGAEHAEAVEGILARELARLLLALGKDDEELWALGGGPRPVP